MSDEFEGGPLWKRAANLVGVSFPERTIELIVVPYETPVDVPWGGRQVRETIARSAFEGIQRRANRVPVNVDHSETVPSTIGRAIAFHPSREEGLVAELKIARTQLGDHTLELAADDNLGASAGFQVKKGGLQWQSRDAYRVVKAFLKHIAMTPDPAYEGARVLAVRTDPVPTSERRIATPNLDRVRADILRERYDRLSR